MDFQFPDVLESSKRDMEGYHQELLRGLTHKLNNMLAIVQGFSDLILMDEHLDPDTLEQVLHIRSAASGMNQLSERIRAAGGCSQIHKEALDFKSYFHSMEESFHEPFKKLGVEVDFDVLGQLPTLQVDRSRFNDVILELLKNAAEAAAQKAGRALIQVSGPGVVSDENEHRVDILISNSGSEIAKDKVKVVFQPFHSAKTNSHLGLGLTIAAMLCKQMGIRLGINSESNTTTLWLSVPTDKTPLDEASLPRV